MDNKKKQTEKKTTSKTSAKKKTEKKENVIEDISPKSITEKEFDDLTLEELEMLLGILQGERLWLADSSKDLHDEKLDKIRYASAVKSLDEAIAQVNSKLNKINRIITLVHHKITNKIIDKWAF